MTQILLVTSAVSFLLHFGTSAMASDHSFWNSALRGLGGSSRQTDSQPIAIPGSNVAIGHFKNPGLAAASLPDAVLTPYRQRIEFDAAAQLQNSMNAEAKTIPFGQQQEYEAWRWPAGCNPPKGSSFLRDPSRKSGVSASNGPSSYAENKRTERLWESCPPAFDRKVNVAGRKLPASSMSPRFSQSMPSAAAIREAMQAKSFGLQVREQEREQLWHKQTDRARKEIAAGADEFRTKENDRIKSDAVARVQKLMDETEVRQQRRNAQDQAIDEIRSGAQKWRAAQEK